VSAGALLRISNHVACAIELALSTLGGVQLLMLEGRTRSQVAQAVARVGIVHAERIRASYRVTEHLHFRFVLNAKCLGREADDRRQRFSGALSMAVQQSLKVSSHRRSLAASSRIP
jgi:hypothetical protein